MVKYYTYEMQFEDEDREITAEDRELEKQQTEYYSKVIYPEDIGSQDSIPYDDDHDDDDDGNNNNNDADDDDDSSEEDELYTIKDFPHLQEQEQEIKPPKLSRYTDDAAAAAADVDAVKNVLEGIIQSPTSTKNICAVHRLDQQILNKVLENLKNSITQETLNQLTNSLQLAEEDNETASPLPLQAPPHDKDERKGKLTSYIPAAAAAATATVNNVSEEMTQLPASKKIRYAYDDDDDGGRQ